MGAPDAAIQRAERALGVAFPDDYRTFLADPGSVARYFLPSGDFLTLCPADELLGLNDTAGPAGHLPGAVVIGGDGGRELLVYDFRQQPPPLLLVDSAAATWSESLRQAASLTEFLTRFPEHGWRWQ
ncbi:SMI1/KNR4 family protein [Streptomyces sp. NPDC088354]|uniref:SMI1/KNR4 family protein n=1 Tax=Streptomyces sp. NPDC088354 TaxID=3365856 RepID=UPI00381CAB97